MDNNINNRTTFNINSVREFQSRATYAYNDLLDELVKVGRIIDESIEYFDTPTAKEFREQSMEMITNAKNYIEKDIAVYIKNIDYSINQYEETISNINKMVAEEDS